ncbi:MAG TPA: glycosyltransferase family 4 protein [Micromonosporaceae bacterium]|nr:glycosyltransferase family 4 protein [Micromonosporaceae bacterium]
MSRLVYVIPQLGPDESQHFAHIPALLEALGTRTELAAVIERGVGPTAMPGVGLLLTVPGRGRLGRLIGTFNVIRTCAARGHRTYFLRYSRFFLVVLLMTYPLYRHRILLWRSGTADLIEPGRRRGIGAKVDDGINWVLLRFVHRLVTGPETMVGVMARRWGLDPDRVDLLYNDIDPRRFAPLGCTDRARVRSEMGWADDEFVLLFVHRLSFRRGTRLLVPLLDVVRRRLDQPVRLVVVGDGPDRSDLERAAADITDLDVVGPVANHRLPEVYAAADCFLMPSYEEGFPRVLLEAMAAAVPIVTTDAGGSADVVGRDYPYITAVGDVEGMAQKVLAVARLGPAGRGDLGGALRQRAVARFSPGQVAHMLADLL